MISTPEALNRLREGNRRFVAGEGADHLSHGKSRRRELVDSQAPFAAVLGCSDSRVPVEAVFDQGVGDLFVIRVAGNIAAPSQIASVEFAAQAFGTRMVVVLGHTRCGAVQATLVATPGQATPGHLDSIVDRVRPAVEAVRKERPGLEGDLLVHEAVRANVRASVATLRESSVLGPLQSDGLVVVGAEYAVETGEVDFFDVP